MPHRMVRRKRTFIGIQNCERNVEAPRGNFSPEIVDPHIGRFGNTTIVTDQSCDGGFDNVLTDPAVELGACPFHFDVDDTIQHAVNFFHHYWKHA